MALISVAELQKYTNVYPNEDDDTQELYCSAAEDVIKNYLGYDPEEHVYARYYNGNGFNELYLGVRPVTVLTKVEIDGQEQDLSMYDHEDESIFYKDSSNCFPVAKKNIKVTFTAGYLTIPSLIKMTALRIAALLQTEGDNSIGITSKSWDGEGSRTFVNYANYDKYLLPISSYRVVR